MGRQHLGDDHLMAMISDVKTVLNRQPWRDTMWSMLAELYEVQGETQLAGAALERAARLNPLRHAEALAVRGDPEGLRDAPLAAAGTSF